MAFYVKDGQIYKMDDKTQRILISGEEDLETLTGFAPGSIAYTVGMKQKWCIAPNGEWEEAKGGGGDDGDDEGGGGDSGGGHALVVNATFVLDGYNLDHISFDKTAGEMWEAFRTGSVIVVCDTVPPFNTSATWSLIYADHADSYVFTAYNGEVAFTFSASEATDYPAYYP